MHLTLLCAALHQYIPALVPGDAITFGHSPAGRLEIHVPATPTLLQQVATALRDGALVLTGPADPLWDEIERLVTEDRDRLLAQADTLLATLQVHQAAG